MTGWPQRSPPGPGGRNRNRGHDRPSWGAADGRKAWLALIEQARAFGSGQLFGPGAVEGLRAARNACLAAAYPVDGEDAKAAAGAMLELVRTWPQASADRKGWHSASVLELAKHLEAMLDQQASAFARRMTGERDD